MKLADQIKSVSIRQIKSSLSHLLEQVKSGKLDLKDARNELSHLLEQIDSGEEILITRDGSPIAKIVPVG